MQKTTLSLIGVSTMIILLAIAFRIYNGAGGSVKVAGVEVSFEPEPAEVGATALVKENVDQGESAATQLEIDEVASAFVAKPICEGPISSLLSNNIAEVNRWMKTRDSLKVTVLALTETEADFSISDFSRDVTDAFTVRAGREHEFMHQKHKYRFKLNSIYRVRGDLRVNVTMHKVQCV